MPNTKTSEKVIKIEGWRNISHSYALVNQFQLIHWLKSSTAEIQHEDMPFIMDHWSNGVNSAGFSDEDYKLINNINSSSEYNSIYRIYAPFNLKNNVELPTVTFAVTEFGLNSGSCDQKSIDTYTKLGGKIHTPSKWSKMRLIASGISEKIIHVIPHAIDDNYFYKIDSNLINKNRIDLGYTPEDVIVLNVGTHHWNKGLDLTIISFAKARQKNKDLKLILKDQRATYLMNSESFINETLESIGMNDIETINSIKLINGHLSLAQLNSLYNIADVYLTPYRAEGFNLPALEAQACGTPVIATKGGATDDFLNLDYNEFVSGKYIENANLTPDLQINAYIEPDISHIINILEKYEPKIYKNLQEHKHQANWLASCNQILNLL